MKRISEFDRKWSAIDNKNLLLRFKEVGSNWSNIANYMNRINKHKNWSKSGIDC